MKQETNTNEAASVKPNVGTLYGIGVGPGDPELITMKAVTVLKTIDIVFTASSRNNDFSLAEKIAQTYIPEGVPVKALPFAMKKNKAEMQKAWDENAHVIAAELQQGKNAAFLTLGDPMIYSTFGYVAESILNLYPDLPIQTIPGITSFQAAAARINSPLVKGNESLVVAAGTNGVAALRNQSMNHSNMALLKAYKNIEEIVDLLGDKKKNDVVVIRRCGYPDEEIFYDLDEVVSKKVDYWTLILTKSKLETHD